MTTIEEMVGMDVLCNDKTRTFTLKKSIVDKNLLRYAKAKSGILFHVHEVQRYFLVSSCFKLSTILKQVNFFTHIFRSKYFVNPLECFQCLLMFSKLNCGNGL
jgi:hypothetical protein